MGTIKDKKMAEVLHTTIISEGLGIYHKTVNKIYDKLHLFLERPTFEASELWVGSCSNILTFT